ncbi:MAG: sigma-54-dependent Fis family transcriptional regulator [Burkholderiaceae bacterium]|nr:sigma-54-dependent Fis family transcriptional regulator [Burkholderiaceae bacterium]
MFAATESLGISPAAIMLGRAIAKAAPTQANVLIVGESGTGKELVARAIHDRSLRNQAPFVAINCGAISPSLVESALFGHEKGSFTGASATTAGCFEQADGGTLFLDEVTEMPLKMQVQLLRILESGRYHRVGGTSMREVHVRVVAATNRNPLEAVAGGLFRSDLFYRLAVFSLRVPSLRERTSDIAYLAQRFLDELNTQEGTHKTYAHDTFQLLDQYPWPGNVRELKNTIIRAFILADDVIEIQPPRTSQCHQSVKHNDHLKITIGTPLTVAQHNLITATLEHYSGDQRRAALALGISLKTLYSRLGKAQKNSPPNLP